MNNEVFAWYFAQHDEKLSYDDGREVAVGVVHEVEGTPKLCKHGLHGSVRVIDALRYANSSILYRVKISGDLDVGKDKLCGQRREYLARYDVEDVLREFARHQALINIEKIKPYCYSLIIKWLETGDEELGSAAESAARSAADSAAEYAAGSAAGSAAEYAAGSAAEYAAAWSAAWSAAYSAANDMLTKMIEEKFGKGG